MESCEKTAEWVARVRRKADTLKYIPREEVTEEICREAVRKSGMALKYVPVEFRAEEICRKAVFSSGAALKYVPVEFRDHELCREAVSRSGAVLFCVPEEHLDYEICREAMRNCGSALGAVPRDLRDREVCFWALKNCHWIFYEVPQNLREDRSFCLEAVKANGLVLEYIPEEFCGFEMCSAALACYDRKLDVAPDGHVFEAFDADRGGFFADLERVAEDWEKDRIAERRLAKEAKKKAKKRPSMSM